MKHLHGFSDADRTQTGTAKEVGHHYVISYWPKYNYSKHIMLHFLNTTFNKFADKHVILNGTKNIKYIQNHII